MSGSVDHTAHPLVREISAMVVSAMNQPGTATRAFELPVTMRRQRMKQATLDRPAYTEYYHHNGIDDPQDSYWSIHKDSERAEEKIREHSAIQIEEDEIRRLKDALRRAREPDRKAREVAARQQRLEELRKVHNVRMIARPPAGPPRDERDEDDTPNSEWTFEQRRRWEEIREHHKGLYGGRLP
jgi:hypothetical protein